jgi:nitrate reductase gamma subunit
MELLEFARGPGLAISTAVFVAGLAWRLLRVFRRPVRRDLSHPRKETVWTDGLRAIFTKMAPPRGVRIRGGQMLNAYGYHIALAIVAFAFAPHIAFIARHLGVGWPPLPDPVTYLATAVAILGLVVALMYRLTDPVQRLLSTFDDYFSWLVTLLPLLTGMALLPAPAEPDRLAVHLLSLELLLVWLPFGKLSHAALVFVSRWRTGMEFARKGAGL